MLDEMCYIQIFRQVSCPSLCDTQLLLEFQKLLISMGNAFECGSRVSSQLCKVLTNSAWCNGLVPYCRGVLCCHNLFLYIRSCQ
jgi:hypothetical protein